MIGIEIPTVSNQNSLSTLSTWCNFSSNNLILPFQKSMMQYHQCSTYQGTFRVKL